MTSESAMPMRRVESCSGGLTCDMVRRQSGFVRGEIVQKGSDKLASGRKSLFDQRWSACVCEEHASSCLCPAACSCALLFRRMWCKRVWLTCLHRGS